MVKARKGQNGGGGAAAPRKGTGDVAAAGGGPFRSPVGCTGATPGEAEFLAWCREERVRFPSSRLAVLPATGRALVAARDIKMGEVVVEVPDDAVLMADNCSIREVLEEEGFTKPADDEILEQSEFQELRGTAAYDKMMGVVQHPADAPTQVPMLWCEVVEPFIAEHPELGLPGGREGYELYRWATCAVSSYSFILGDDKYQAMVPVWDLLNHITGSVNVRLHHCARRHVLQMIATRDIRNGEELVNNYGELSNAELLRAYGFVEATNRHNHVQVPLGFLVRAAREELEEQHPPQPAAQRRASGAGAGAGPGSASAASDDGDEDGAGALRRRLTARLRLGQRLDLLPQHHVFKVFPDRPPPAAMTALIHVLLASDGEAAALRAAARRAAAAAVAAAPGGAGRRRKGGERQASAAAVAAAVTQAALAAAVQAVSGGGSDAAAAAMKRVYERVVERMLGRYGGSLEEDVRLLERYDSLSVRHRAAVLARKPEKEALVALREVVRRPDGLQRSLATAASKSAAGGSEARTGGGKAVAAAGGGEEEEEEGGKEGKGGRERGREKAGRGGARAGVGVANGQPAADQFSFGFAL
ncbi:hypothetical protein GPECTOR_1g328 [Gonium pectorale]|uniref:SET domain-containing protein n=1 Tax=Gonium pectorale TaxID=33097 RepID=A0A150H470_GONPE|nr:hypothetical protein GPECTOR_1g328 [Gonium pectorale]|eukprot:KXZ56370.1 hypothetical protein GPECTOR_1g328 [Gonium pectorale]